MAAQEVTGGDAAELDEMRADFRGTPVHQHDIEFETAFCLSKIRYQPDEYEGPHRFCKRRAAKLTHEEWDEKFPDRPFRNWEPESFHPSCQFHGRCNGSDTTGLEGIRQTANLKHGMYASDDRLREDFEESDERLYDEILEWAEIYDFPSREEDPARWKLLEKLAINEVRSLRGYLYLYDEGEVQLKDIYDDQGVVVGNEPDENALAKEYRLLQSTLVDLMKELGLTPKERKSMETRETEVNAADRFADVAERALSTDKEYDPDDFET